MTKRPNFLFIITDQHRHDHLGCAGNAILKTPNIDKLASGGVRLDNFYVASAVCMPNRASIMTGRMPSVHGVRFNGIPLAKDSVTFVDLLRNAGYRTALVGKSHLQNFTDLEVALPDMDEDGELPPDDLAEATRARIDGPEYQQERVPNAHIKGYSALETPFYGFDQVDLCTRHGDRVRGHYDDWLAAKHPDPEALRSRKNLIPAEDYSAPQAYRTSIPEELYSTAYVGERTEAFLTDYATGDRQRPFYIQCSFPDPHHPYTPPGQFWEMYDPAEIPLPASYYQEDLPPTVADIHRQTAEGVRKRNTIYPFHASERETQEIIALTYGMIANVDAAIGRIVARLEALGLANNTIIIFTSDHGDFMGDRGIMLKGPLHYQGIAKVPFIWHEPGESQPGRTLSGLGSSLDIPSTVLSRAGLAPFNGMQGKDLSPLLEGRTDNLREGLLIEQDTQGPNFGFDGPIRARTYVTRKWRMSLYQGSSFAELYDLENDPHEMVNLWGKTPEQGALLAAMVDAMTSLQDHSPRPTMYA